MWNDFWGGVISCCSWQGVGHTHSLIDQRFSIIAGILARAKTLETPQDALKTL